MKLKTLDSHMTATLIQHLSMIHHKWLLLFPWMTMTHKCHAYVSMEPKKSAALLIMQINKAAFSEV
jgi:hypothetical protein